MSLENIGYIVYILLGASAIFTLSLVIYFINSYKKNKMNKGITNINMLHNSKEVQKKKEVIKEKEIEKGVSVHLDKNDIKRMNNFKISGLALFKNNLSKNNRVLSGDLNGHIYLLSSHDFYFGIHKYINKLFEEEILSFGKKDLFKIHSIISKMNLNLLKKELLTISEKNRLFVEGIGNNEKIEKIDILLRKIIVNSLDDESYLLYGIEEKKKFQEKIEDFKRVLNKKIEDEKSLTEKDLLILDQYYRELEEQDKINKEIKKGIKVNLLEYNFYKKELHLNIHYNDLMNKKIENIISYYKGKKEIVTKILFYI